MKTVAKDLSIQYLLSLHDIPIIAAVMITIGDEMLLPWWSNDEMITEAQDHIAMKAAVSHDPSLMKDWNDDIIMQWWPWLTSGDDTTMKFPLLIIMMKYC